MGWNKKTVIFSFFVGFVLGAVTSVGAGYYLLKRTDRPYYKMDAEFQEMFVVAQLDEILQKIEMFNLVNDRYPDNLNELRHELLSGAMFIDPASRNTDCGHEYYYYLDKQINKYHLLSVGKDRVLFSEDDILPEVANQGISRLGITSEQRSGVKYPEITCYEWAK